MKGVNYPVTSWKQVLVQTLEVVGKPDRERLRLYINSNTRLTRNKQNVFRHEAVLVNGLSIETNHSAETIYYLCLDIIDAFGIDKKDALLAGKPALSTQLHKNSRKNLDLN